MITEGVRTILLSQSSVTDIVGSNGAFLSYAPQSRSLPYIIVDCDVDDHNLTLEGTLADSHELFSAEVTIECWSTTPSKANDLGNVVWQYLDGFRGIAGNQTIESAEFQNRLNDHENPQSGQDFSRCVNEIRFLIHYRP